ncbi:Dabb family protein [Massilia sp. ST3]|uniref:Dabb family protein n=1 Tax=Massilia sp. ST3 TaxID=2824903 RepID=UPI001B842C96|nr:Dabb family protein [Massilia sp. ST3]MBQ5946520.1 Dabb family protein [Massilia sp. ST3]
MSTNAPASLRHVVLFSFKDSASAEQVDAIVSDFESLEAAISGIAGFEWGTNVSPEGLNDGFSHCFTLSFASLEDRDAYLVHPEHQRFVSTLGGCLEKSLVVDYWAR